MSFDLIALGILGLFALLGAWRGALAGGFGLGALVAGYLGAAAAASGGLADWVAARGVPEMFSVPVAGTVGFLIVYLLVSFVGKAFVIWERRRRGDEPMGTLNRVGGAAFGATRGLIIVVLLSMLFTWLDAAREFGVWENPVPVPSTEGSLVAGASGQIIENAVESAVGGGDGAAGKVMARIASHPREALSGIQQVVDDPGFQRLQDDQFFWTLVENGANERALNRGTFYAITHDPEMRRKLADLGLVTEAAADDTDAFRREVGAMLDEVGPRLRGLSDDAELQRLAEDPEVIAMLESGDTLGLLAHPGIQRLVARLSAEPKPQS